MRRIVLKNNQRFLNFDFLPGKIMLVGSDNLSSPTTESERTGVYLQDKIVKLYWYRYLKYHVVELTIIDSLHWLGSAFKLSTNQQILVAISCIIYLNNMCTWLFQEKPIKLQSFTSSEFMSSAQKTKIENILLHIETFVIKNLH